MTMKQASELIQWVRLDAFTMAYIECAFWSSVDMDHDGDCLDERYGIEDVSQDGLWEAIEACNGFRELCAEEGVSLDDWSDEQAGHDLWLTRNGHGAGFWDRGLGERGERLSEAARAYGSVDLYVGDDGKLYVS